MRFFGLMDRREIGVGVASFVVPYAIGLAIAGSNPSDEELLNAFWAGAAVAFVVMTYRMWRDSRDSDK